MGIGMSSVVTWGAGMAMVAALGMATIPGITLGLVSFAVFAAGLYIGKFLGNMLWRAAQMCERNHLWVR